MINQTAHDPAIDITDRGEYKAPSEESESSFEPETPSSEVMSTTGDTEGQAGNSEVVAETGQDYSTPQTEESKVEEEEELPIRDGGSDLSPDSTGSGATTFHHYDSPRPALTIEEASTILGKSIRSIERSIQGKWGNKLPDGWKARKFKIDGQLEWRIIPPQGFTLKRFNIDQETDEKERRLRAAEQKLENLTRAAQNQGEKVEEETNEDGPGMFGLAIEKLLQSAGKKARQELSKVTDPVSSNSLYQVSDDFDDHPTIIIDRSDEVEKLLRELSTTRQELADERKQHIEDLRLLSQMQGSMRLLEVNASQTNTLKEELELTKSALKEHKEQYREFLALPWWKRLFRRMP